MSDIKEKLIALIANYTDSLSFYDIHKADFAEEFVDHLLDSGVIEELQNEAYDLGVESVLHERFGLSWSDAEELRKEIARLKETTTWISIQERLPEESLQVMTIDNEKWIEIDAFNGDNWISGRTVTHWMPLPLGLEETQNV